MTGRSASNGDLCPVRWLNRHALVRLPERVDQSNAGQVRDELLAVTSHPVLALLADLTGTTICDHACGDALARVFLRTMARGIDLRLVACTDQVLRALSMSGLDRVLPVYRTVDAALAATDPADGSPVLPAKEGTAFPEGDVGVEIALLGEDGKSAGATVTLSLARARSRALLAAGRPGPGEPGRDLISGMADRLAAVSDLLEVSATRVPAPVDGHLQQAISELATVIRDARAARPELQP